MHYISGELAGSTAMSFVPSFSVHSNYECIMLSVNYLEDIWCDYLQRTVCECDGPGTNTTQSEDEWGKSNVTYQT